MLVTYNQRIYERALFLRDHGRSRGDKLFFNTEVAYKYKMSNMQAALGLAQLERIEELVARKREIFNWYQEELADVDGLDLNNQMPGTSSAFWMVTIVLDPKYGMEKEELMRRLGAENIDCRPFFYPLSSLPAYQQLEQAKQARQVNHVSYQVSRRALNLPSALNLNRDKVKYVCQTLKAVLQC